MLRQIALVIVCGMAFAYTMTLAQAPPLPKSQQPPPPQTPRPAPRGAAKAPTPLTLRQVLESLSTLKNSKRVEDQISRAGVQFKATPETVDILKQFGASPKLISLIPAPPAAPAPPKPPEPKIAGALTVACEPIDCLVVIKDKYEGATEQGRKTVNGLQAGPVNVEVFADGYEHVTRTVQMEEGKPREETFSLKPGALQRQQAAKATLLKVMSAFGGTDGLAELGDIEGSGSMQWTASNGGVEQWPMTFNKRVGRDLVTTFKPRDGQCNGSVAAKIVKAECRGGLRNSGEKIAEQGTSLFLSYQLQDVLNTMMSRPLTISETDASRLESPDSDDYYVFTVGKDGLISELTYRIGEDPAIRIQYSNYFSVNRSRYPGRIAMGRLNAEPTWVFTINNVRSKIGRNQ
jgi:hypothetical protein